VAEGYGGAGVISLAWRVGGALLLILVLMAGSGATAWRWQANSYSKQLAEQSIAHQADLTAISNAASTQARQALEKQQAAQQTLADLDIKATKEKTHDLAENETLRRAVADGARRLRIAGSCRSSGSDMPGTASTTSLDNGGTVELAPAAGRTVFDIRAGIIADQAALRALQAYVMNACR
jgi:prophage endopeptidase